jgi:hypothetical protein
MTDRELMQMEYVQATPHEVLIAEIMDCRVPKNEREHAAADEIQSLRDRLAQPEPEPVAIGEEWKPCVKLPIVVHVREQRKGETHVSTREGITPVKEDDLIMRGVAGEEYPIGRELFNSTYTFDTAPVHAIDISQERVDETAKHEHEFFCPRCGHCCREWVGLTDEEVGRLTVFDGLTNIEVPILADFVRAIEAKLKEKNT